MTAFSFLALLARGAEEEDFLNAIPGAGGGGAAALIDEHGAHGGGMPADIRALGAATLDISGAPPEGAQNRFMAAAILSTLVE